MKAYKKEAREKIMNALYSTVKNICESHCVHSKVVKEENEDTFSLVCKGEIQTFRKHEDPHEFYLELLTYLENFGELEAKKVIENTFHKTKKEIQKKLQQKVLSKHVCRNLKTSEVITIQGMLNKGECDAKQTQEPKLQKSQEIQPPSPQPQDQPIQNEPRKLTQKSLWDNRGTPYTQKGYESYNKAVSSRV